MSLILADLASLSFLRAVASAASAESVQRKRSYLGGKLGERSAWEGFTLFDDGLLPSGAYSGSRDGEGTPRRRVRIFGRGTLESLLHSSYTAGKAGCRSTGHATASGLPAPTNLIPELGPRPASELIAETERGLYVVSGGIAPDGVSGEVLASVNFGFALEGGKIARPVKNAVVASTAVGMLSGMNAVSSDYRDYAGNLAPTIRFGSVLLFLRFRGCFRLGGSGRSGRLLLLLLVDGLLDGLLVARVLYVLVFQGLFQRRDVLVVGLGMRADLPGGLLVDRERRLVYVTLLEFLLLLPLS